MRKLFDGPSERTRALAARPVRRANGSLAESPFLLPFLAFGIELPTQLTKSDELLGREQLAHFQLALKAKPCYFGLCFLMFAQAYGKTRIVDRFTVDRNIETPYRLAQALLGGLHLRPTLLIESPDLGLLLIGHAE